MTDALRDELKDETGTSIPLKRLEAAVSVQRGQLRQDLIQANRELLEWHLATELEKEPQQPVSLRSKDRVFGRTVLNADQAYRLWFFWRAGIVFVISLLVIDLNSTSLHGFYRTQIARNWIEPIDGVGRELPLAQLDTVAHGAPYHLISTSLNLMGRRKKDRGDTQADHFLFSKLYCGSDPVGYVRTAWFAGGKYKLPDAIAISGAAVSPAQNTGLLIRALLFLGNLRLGQWLPNPGHVSRLPMWWQRLLSPFWVTPGRVGWQSLQRAEERPHVFVTDGGHHENLGIGPLLERRCRLIVAFDAGADEHFDFVDLASLVRWAKLKHGIHIAPLTNQDLLELMPTKLMDGAAPNQEKTSVRSKASVPAQETATAPESRRLAAQHWIAARIEYPADPSQSKDASGQEQPKPLGLLIYVKTTITGEEPFEVLRYARINKHFPHDSTADQLYDPDQFATYVQLGHHIADEIQKVIRQQPHRLWQQCGPDDGFKKDMEAFLKTLS